MPMKRYLLPLIIVILIIVIVLSGYYFFYLRNTIISITLTSPHNTAMHNAAEVTLEKPCAVHIVYKEKETGVTFRTVSSPEATVHHLDMLLLKANTEYTYRVILEGLFSQQSKEISFKTREQSPWLRNRWLYEHNPHDATALGDGMVMVCYGRAPGYIAIVDGEGNIRWYWQVDDIGVRAATFTPRGTIIAMLRPPALDMADDQPMTHDKVLEENPRPQRRGKMGFAGGTAIVEIDMAGNTIRRIDLKDQPEADCRVIHHDLRMDNEGNIHTLNRPAKVYDLSPFGGAAVDTLYGDGIVVIDTLGKARKVWDAWDHWDIVHDPYIERYGYDRFHMNALFLDHNGDYLLSVPIEDQIWKVDGKTGEIKWKLGRNGDFRMDTTSYFSFQHTPYLNEKGDLVLFDNGLFNKLSRTLVFRLDTVDMEAGTLMDVRLPKDKYTARMGSGTILPNGNVLQTSSKTGSIMVTDTSGSILWEIVTEFTPYRAEYVPEAMWKSYFIQVH